MQLINEVILQQQQVWQILQQSSVNIAVQQAYSAEKGKYQLKIIFIPSGLPVHEYCIDIEGKKFVNVILLRALPLPLSIPSVLYLIVTLKKIPQLPNHLRNEFHTCAGKFRCGRMLHKVFSAVKQKYYTLFCVYLSQSAKVIQRTN